VTIKFTKPEAQMLIGIVLAEKIGSQHRPSIKGLSKADRAAVDSLLGRGWVLEQPTALRHTLVATDLGRNIGLRLADQKFDHVTKWWHIER